MNRLTIHISVVFAVGLGLTLALLWLLIDHSRSLPVAYAAELHVCRSGCALSSVQAAVDAANDGDVIKVAAGTYTDVNVRPRNDIATTGFVTQVVYISKTVTIHGGYTTTNWITSYPITQPTTLNAQGQGRVVYITGNISPTIEGLRITGGSAAELDGGGSEYISGAGGGVYVITASVTISNNQIFGNDAGICSTAFCGWYNPGGGLYLQSSASVLNGNIIMSNTADYGGGLFSIGDAAMDHNTVAFNKGGGLDVKGTTVILHENTIYSNDGTGLFLQGQFITVSGNAVTANTFTGVDLFDAYSATLNENVVSFNRGDGLSIEASGAVRLSSNTLRANVGAGLSIHDGTPRLVNNVVADNDYGISIYPDPFVNSSFDLMHNTIARNYTGIYVFSAFLCGPSDCRYYPITVALTNTILTGNYIGIYTGVETTATLQGTLWGTGMWANGSDWAGEGNIITGTMNIWGNPAFVNPNAGDYHIALTSAAIDKGVNAGVMTDIDGDTRPDRCSFDIGADEFITGVECNKHIYLPLIFKIHL